MKANHNRSRIKISGPFCVYCGQLANTDEHFPPASKTNFGFLLPCCRECNNIAGTEHGSDFQKRVDHVKRGLSKKYRTILTIPRWDEDDLEELSGNLQRGIVRWQNQKRIAHSRIAWNVESYLASIDRNNDFVPMVADFAITTK